jgi:hypothetical protein
MVRSMEITACLGMLALAGNFAVAEYRKLRSARRCTDALRRTLCAAVAD